MEKPKQNESIEIRSKKNIIVHHNDLDGCVSAALLVRELIQQGEIYSLVPVMYLGNQERHREMLESLIKSHFTTGMDHKVFILDFPWHPLADVWIDHHGSSMEHAPREAMKYLIPQLDSAAEAVAIYLQDTCDDYQESLNTTWAISWTGKIDSAKYDGISEYYNCNNPWLVLRLFTDHDKQAHRTARIAELLAQYDLDAQIVVDIIGGADKAIEKFQSDIKSVERAIVENHGVGIIITRHRNDFPRYSEYIMRPDIKYSIRVTNAEHGREIKVGRNIWHPKMDSTKDIGRIMADLFPDNGGGHAGIGGAIVSEPLYEDALNKIWEKLVS